MNYLKLTIYAIMFTAGIMSADMASAANSSIFTLEAWVKPATSVATKAIVAKAEEMRLVTDASGNPACQIKSGAAWQTAEVSSSAISVGSWAHVACSYNKANLKVFVNGVETGSTALTVAVDDTVADLKLGTDDSADAVYGEFEGVIDDLRFYNYARTQKQIVEDMNAGHPAGGSPVGSQVGYWKFDEGYGDTAHDSSPQGNDGDLAGACPGAATCPTWTNEGKFGKALSFDQSGDSVTLGSVLSGSGEFSISAWINPAEVTSAWKTVVAAGCTGPDMTISGATVMIGRNCGQPPGVFYSPTTVSANVWTHLVMVYDGTNANVYKNGVEYSGGAVTYTHATMYVGSYNGVDELFNGSIDEVKIYNYALTEDEVRVDYNQGKAAMMGAISTESDGVTPSNAASRAYCVPGDTSACNPPVAEWKFDERTGTSAYDTSGNGNTGTWAGTGTHWGNGKYGSGGVFNGSDDYVGTALTGSSVGPNETIEAWIYPTGNGYVESLGFDNSGQCRGFSVTGASLNYKCYGSQWNGVSGVITQNQWNHVVGTIDNSGNDMKLFINGLLVDNDSVTGSACQYASCGVYRTGTNVWPVPSGVFNGKIDQVRIYNYARTAAQVAWDYNRGKPIAEWRFDECQGGTAHDESGNGNDGTITIGATGTQTSLGTCTDGLSTSAWSNGVDGKYNSAMSFDGVDDWVEVGDNSIFNITDEITIEVWMNMDDWGANDTDVISKTNNPFRITLPAGGLTPQCYMTINGTLRQVNPPAITLNTWNHLVLIYDKDGGANNFIAYTNGVAGTPATWTGLIGTSANPIVIGAMTSSQFHFNGLIDSVKIYNYALTPLQVKTEYNNGAVRFE